MSVFEATLKNSTLYLSFMIIFPVIALRRENGHHRSFQIDENIFLKRCELKYCSNKKDECNLNICIERMMKIEKFGSCPNSSLVHGIDAVCIDTCDGFDYRCPGQYKCCSNTCGRTCQSPTNLFELPDTILPPIPNNISLISIENHRNHRRTAEISWKMNWRSEPMPGSVVYVVEAKAHTGYTYFEHKLSNWFNLNIYITYIRSNYNHGQEKTVLFSADLKLRPGRWYKFRIAAINENGTRGYSDNSHVFQLKERPKNPMAPQNFTIETPPKLLNNRSVYTKASWNHPKSDYPIEKYKITWSLYLESNNGSLWLNEAYIQEPTRYFELWDLKPNSLYYLQLQALSTFGRKRLKSPIKPLFINTTVPSSTNIFFTNRSLKTNITGSQQNLSIKFIGSKKYHLIVRVIWPQQYIGSVLELCVGHQDCLPLKRINSTNMIFNDNLSKLFKAIRPKKNHFNFVDLKYETRYTIRLNTAEKSELIKTFVTPSCYNFAQKHPNLVSKC